MVRARGSINNDVIYNVQQMIANHFQVSKLHGVVNLGFPGNVVSRYRPASFVMVCSFCDGLLGNLKISLQSLGKVCQLPPYP